MEDTGTYGAGRKFLFKNFNNLKLSRFVQAPVSCQMLEDSNAFLFISINFNGGGAGLNKIF